MIWMALIAVFKQLVPRSRHQGERNSKSKMPWLSLNTFCNKQPPYRTSIPFHLTHCRQFPEKFGWEAKFVSALAVIGFVVMAAEIYPAEWVMFIMTMICWAADIITPRQATAGFANLGKFRKEEGV